MSEEVTLAEQQLTRAKASRAVLVARTSRLEQKLRASNRKSGSDAGRTLKQSRAELRDMQARVEAADKEVAEREAELAHARRSIGAAGGGGDGGAVDDNSRAAGTPRSSAASAFVSHMESSPRAPRDVGGDAGGTKPAKKGGPMAAVHKLRLVLAASEAELAERRINAQVK